MSLWKWWTAVAGMALVLGGVAWLLKLWVIVTTDGRVVATGAAATFFDLGLGLLLVGSTGVGLRLAMNQETSMRVVLAVASPLVFMPAFLVFSVLGYALVAIGRIIVGDTAPGYLLEEGGIFISAVVGIAVGVWLVVDVVLRGAAHGTDPASGSRKAQH